MAEYGDYAALTGDPESYLTAAGDLKNRGMVNAGVFGTACPVCYREINLAGAPVRGQCKCKDRPPVNVDDVLTVLGFPGVRHHMAERRPV